MTEQEILRVTIWLTDGPDPAFRCVAHFGNVNGDLKNLAAWAAVRAIAGSNRALAKEFEIPTSA